MNTRIPALTILLCALAACAGAPATSDTPLPPPAASTIAMPDNDSLLAQQLRQSLAGRGWTLTEYDAASLQDSRDYGRIARRARYRLTLSATRIGACRDSSPSFLYNIVLIENSSGDVGMALTGANCMATTIKRFEAEMDRKQLTVPPGGHSNR